MGDPKYFAEPVEDLILRAGRAVEKYGFPEGAKVTVVSHGECLTALKHALSCGKEEYYGRKVTIIQGNVLCCDKEIGADKRFCTLF